MVDLETAGAIVAVVIIAFVLGWYGIRTRRLAADAAEREW